MSEARYMSLYKELRSLITQGDYGFGKQLPSKRTLAADKGLSLITVEHALNILCEEGYIQARPRSGYYVIYQPDALFPVASDLPLPPGSTASEAEGSREQFPFGLWARAVRRVLSEQQEALFQRAPGVGILPLRLALCAYLSRSRGLHVQPDQLIIGSGAEYFYGLLATLLGPRRLFGIEEPSYPLIRQVYEAQGLRCESLLMGSDGILSSALQESRAQVLHLTPYNSYPSGITASASKRAEYVRFARERKAYIIEDDYDSEFTLSSKAEETLFSLVPEGRGIYLNTFSRTIAPSLRAGYMVLPPRLMQKYRQQAGFYSCSVPVLEQYVLAYLLDSGDFERHINRVRRRLRREELP